MPSSPSAEAAPAASDAPAAPPSSSDAPLTPPPSKPASTGVKDEPILVGDDTPIARDRDQGRDRAQERHEADLAAHAYEPPRPARVQDE